MKAWLYVAGEAGVVSIFRVGAAAPAKIGERFLADNTRVVAVDPSNHPVFFPLRIINGKAVPRVMEPK